MKRLVTIKYNFNSCIYESYTALAAAFCQFPTRAAFEVSSKGFAKKFVKDKDIYNKVLNALRTFKCPDVRLSAIIYILDPNAGVFIDGYMYFSINEIANNMYMEYPKYIDKIRKYFKEGLMSYIYYNPSKIKGNSALISNASLMKVLEVNFDINFIYYYFMETFRTNKGEYDARRMLSRNELINEIIYRINKVYDRALIDVFDMVYDNVLLLQIVDHIGFDKVYEFCVNLNGDYFYYFLDFIDEHFYIHLDNTLIQEGYHIWLVKNYKVYKYHSREAKRIKRKLKKLHRIIYNVGLSDSDFQKIGSRALILYKKFNDLFAKNLLITTKCKHISTNKFEYYLAIEMNDVCVPKDYYAKNFTQLSTGTLLDLTIAEKKEAMGKEIVSALFEYQKVIKDSEQDVDVLKYKKLINKRNNSLLSFNLMTSLLVVILSILFTGFLFAGMNMFAIIISYEFTDFQVILNPISLSFVMVSIIIAITLFLSHLIKRRFIVAFNIYESFQRKFEKFTANYSKVLAYTYGNEKKSTSLSNPDQVLINEKEFKKITNTNVSSIRPLDKEIKNYENEVSTKEIQSTYMKYLKSIKGIRNNHHEGLFTHFLVFIFTLLVMTILNYTIMQVLVQLSKNQEWDFVRNLIGEISRWDISFILVFPITYTLLFLIFPKQSIFKEVVAIILGILILLLGIYLKFLGIF